MSNTTGTAGNRPGYKVFSINTTIRNPKRNRDFLLHFVPFEGKIMDVSNANEYFKECLKDGTYTVMDVPQKTLVKLANGKTLNDEEAERLILDNPQACGTLGRVMTQLRALKDEGFLWFDNSLGRIYMTQLGKELVDNKIDASIIYTKAMLALQANNPGRVAMYNKSRPFLNTLFTISELKKEWPDYSMEKECKGVHFYEFAAFILSMKDCDYKEAAQKIINYRLKEKKIGGSYHKQDMDALNKHLKSLHLLPVKSATLDAYADDVFRKFEMTGLVYKRGGAHRMNYIDFAPGCETKIDVILREFADYKYIAFTSPKEYADSMSNISLPWIKNDNMRWKIVKDRAKALNITLQSEWNLGYCEQMLDRISSQSALDKVKDKYTLEDINQELLILAKHSRNKHRKEFEGLPNSLLLEYLLALLLAKRYGTEGLVSNILYNPEGQPLCCAAGGKADIVFHHHDGSYILEPTLLSTKDQQLNSETMNIARHVKDEMRGYPGSQYRVMMVAPKVHEDVVLLYVLMDEHENIKMIPTTIDRSVFMINKSESISSLNTAFDDDFRALLKEKEGYRDMVNSFRLQ